MTRREMLAVGTGISIGGLSGCMDWLAARADRDLPIKTLAVRNPEDGQYYHPTQENIESGVYAPLTRPLFIYVNHASLEHKPALMQAFLRFFFERQRALAREVGYYATAEDVPEANLEQLNDVMEELGLQADEAGRLTGEIVCSGSNTVAPITRAAGEDFEREHEDVLVAVEPEGTGAGFAEFVQGNADIQSASRTILPEEQARAEEYGVAYSHYEIGWDGLAIVVHEDNDWLAQISPEELKQMWDYNSEITHWDDLDEDMPNDRISLWGRDSASGTFDFFTETINGEVGRIRTDYSPHTDTGSVMSGVAHSVFSFGWGGVGYYTELKEDPFGHI